MPKNEERSALTEAVFYILLCLFSPMHGYAIMQNVSKLSGGRVALGAGTLYGALGTLVQKGFIKLHKDSNRKKEYIITALGKKAVAAEIDRLYELAENGRRIYFKGGGV